MKITEYKVQWVGLEAGCKNISVVELIEYLQKIDSGSGDYVEERQVWQQKYSVDMLLGAVELG